MNLTASHRLQCSWITWPSRTWFSLCPGSPGPLLPAWNSCHLCRSGPGSASPRSPRGDDHRHPAPSHRRHRGRELTIFATRWPRAYGGRIVNKMAVGALNKCTWHKWFVFVFVTLGILEWLGLPQGVVWTSRPLTRLCPLRSPVRSFPPGPALPISSGITGHHRALWETPRSHLLRRPGLLKHRPSLSFHISTRVPAVRGPLRGLNGLRSTKALAAGILHAGPSAR